MRAYLTIVLLAASVFQGCGACGEDKLSEVISPNGAYVSTVFRRSCGATTGFLYHVNLRTSKDSFSADTRGVIESGQIFLTREGKITLTWRDDKTLQVSCDTCPKDRKPAMANSWNEVSISYELR